MKKIVKIKKTKKLKINTILASLYLLLFAICLSIFISTFSENLTSITWDGSVSTSLNGTGTTADPYLINNGADFAYFLSVSSNPDYFNKYYKLTKNINFNNLELGSLRTSTDPFSGHFDGNGYTIFNIKLDNYNTNNGSFEYGIFAYLNNANISNLNIHDANINIEDLETSSNIGILASKAINSTFYNVSLYANALNINNVSDTITVNNGSLFGNDLGSNTLTSVNVSYTSNIAGGSLIGNYNNSTFTNIIANNSLTLLGTGTYTGSGVKYYNVSNNSVIFTDSSSIRSVVTTLDQNSVYEWVIDGTNFRIRNNEKDPNSAPAEGMTPASFTLHDSGIDGDTVYVNDLAADYNYYLGVNYTYSSDGTLPTLANKNLYSNSNLVKVKITYNGTDNSNSLTGTVSLTETQSKFVYFKYYPVVDNYITIELLDNPFGNRPTDKVFNGWVTNYVGASISYDSIYYVRKVKIPVTLNNGIPNDIEITMHASWISGSIELMNNASWTSAFSNLKDVSMVQIGGRSPVYEDVSGYYITGTVNRYSYYPTGAVDVYGDSVAGNRCRTYGGCTYYKLSGSSTYDSSLTYYNLSDQGYYSYMEAYTPQITGYTTLPGLTLNTSASGFYKEVTINYGASYAGYYNGEGAYQASGTCYTSGGCTYYELIQYYDANGRENLADGTDRYYYLVTRDTNIIVMTGNTSTSWSTAQNKPFTLTSLHNGTDYRNNVTWNINNRSVICYNDTRIEFIKVTNNDYAQTADTGPSSSTNGGDGELWGYYHNVKVGRGITRSGTYNNFASFNGGYTSGTGSSSNITHYTAIIESGYYDAMTLSQGVTSYGNTSYIEMNAIYGSDYDRVTNVNTNLSIAYTAAASWGGTYYSSSNAGISFNTLILSGTFGANKYDYTTGIYVGGLNYGTYYTARKLTVYGGSIYNIVGGVLTATNRSNYNDTYIYICGGSVDSIVGGAGHSATYGNRLIQITGGTVNYSVFGGSNGYSGSGDDGTVNGSSYIYVGGTGEIGSATNVNNNSTLWGAEAGSVFGIGNGRSGYTAIGSNDNSYVVINGGTIRRNVYGGGNYGATGINSTSNTTTTAINIHNGSINGSVYGGGNNNGAGSTSITSTINILMDGGTVSGNIYGGSRTLGTIYGNTNLNINSGTITGDVYGGGEGGYSDGTASGTFVTKNVNVTIGTTTSSPSINNVYGGSAYGTVNADATSAEANSNTVNVTVNNGTITNSVFGGAKGSATFTPYVKGNITVNINGGTMANVFGGFDAAGSPEGTDYVYLNGGVIGSAFGGGNNTSQTTTNIYLQGATTSNIFGGSNQSGTVTTTNVTTTSGTVSNIYGGNNLGGTATTTNVNINGGTINTAVYGGGNEAPSGTTNVTLTSSANKIPNVFGGGNAASVTSSNVTMAGVNAENVFGGSNSSGNVTTSIVKINGGSANYVYGGNNVGGKTITSNIYGNYGGTATNVFGGGKSVDAGTTNIYLQGANVDNTYGGSNTSGTVTESNITVTGGTLINIYGGNNEGGETTTSHVTYNGANLSGIIYGGGYSANTGTTNVIINSTWNNLSYVFGGGKSADAGVTNVTMNGGNITNVFGGSNTSGTITNSNVNIISGYPTNVYGGNNQGGTCITSHVNISGGTESYVYGGNNEGGSTTNANVNITGGNVSSAYGGGNLAVTGNTTLTVNGATIGTVVYGGGNAAGVTNGTDVNIINATISGNVFGGGNAGSVGTNTDVYFSNSTCSGSVHGGGNGSTAVVFGNTLLNIDGNSNITGNVFGGGNAAPTGTEDTNNSYSYVNIVGGTIDGNVYGGANTSVLYGAANVKIGYAAVNNTALTKGDIHIKGTVFGGGEANASGSENYDFTFISVTKRIDILIDALDHTSFLIDGSIFGSGNASSTAGTSYVVIKNYGTFTDYKKNVSIQRADMVTIDHSAIELIGAADHTASHPTTPFSISNVDVLKLKNNSSIFLKSVTNMVQKFMSVVDVNGIETKGYATISDTGVVTKNVDNRLYAYQGKVINIATNESNTAYGEVYGMSFFGLYSHDRNDKVYTAMYDQGLNTGDTLTSGDLYYFTSGSYVSGKHNTNHNIKVDGFYSNYANPDDNTKVIQKYIEPTPAEASYYNWLIGEEVNTIEFTLSASKYSTLGTYELALDRYAGANSTYTIIGFNYDDLETGVSLVNPSSIPRIAASTAAADTTFGLTIKSGNAMITNGSTNFYTNPTTSFSGTLDYQKENSSTVPSLIFYLYHSKNIATTGGMGTVVISLIIVTPINDITNEVKRVNLNITLEKVLESSNDYEGTITPGKQYEMFATSSVNITSKSTFSAYYSFLAMSDQTLYRTGYHHTLVSTYVLPENTKITMVDLEGTNPEYYYYIVTAADVTNATAEFNQYGEASYNISNFTKMGSTSTTNNYNEAAKQAQYYDSSTGYTQEEFIFMLDFGEANITADATGRLTFEMRDTTNQTIINVHGSVINTLYYNLYYNKDATIDVTASLNKTSIYGGDSAILTVDTNFIQNTINTNTIIDTNFYDQKLGLKLSIYDSNGNKLNGTSLMGISFTYKGMTYYPRTDGSVRINIAERVANVQSKITLNSNQNTMATGDYTIRVESFGSPDGIYYGLTPSDMAEVTFHLVDMLYGLKATTDDNNLIMDHTTGYNLSGNNINKYTVKYSSGLVNPSIQMELQRRKYDTVDSLEYEQVNLQDYVTNTLTATVFTNEYQLTNNPDINNVINLNFKDNLMTGTYRLYFKLYDGQTFVGSVYKYIIIK